MTQRDEALFQVLLPDGQECTVYPLLFAVRICVGRVGAPWYDRGW